MNLSAKQREAAFPITIELGKSMGDGMSSGPVDVMPSKKKGEKGKERKFYPTVYIDSMPGLEQLPKEGCMLVEFRRKRLSIEENSDGEDTTGVTLELRSICLPEGGGSEDDDEDSSDMETAMRNAMKKTTSEKDDEDDDEE